MCLLWERAAAGEGKTLDVNISHQEEACKIEKSCNLTNLFF